MLTLVITAPRCATSLMQANGYGAEIVKVERVERSDPSRTYKRNRRTTDNIDTGNEGSGERDAHGCDGTPSFGELKLRLRVVIGTVKI